MRAVGHDHEIGIPQLPRIDRRRLRRELAAEPAGEALEALQQHGGIDRGEWQALGLELLIVRLDGDLIEADELLIEDGARLRILEPPMRLERIADQSGRDAGRPRRCCSVLDVAHHMRGIIALEPDPEIEAGGIDSNTRDPHVIVRTDCRDADRDEGPVRPSSPAYHGHAFVARISGFHDGSSATGQRLDAAMMRNSS